LIPVTNTLALKKSVLGKSLLLKEKKIIPHPFYSLFHSFNINFFSVNGSVVRVTHKYKKNLHLAIKRCRLDPDREYKAAIVRELRIMATGHSNLIRLREVTLWREDVWMAMDLQRCSVFAVLCQRGIPEEYTVHIACEALKALNYLHTKGFIHRDVKCENLLLGWNGEVKLGKFIFFY
jgi:serine/threonine protein kinase